MFNGLKGHFEGNNIRFGSHQAGKGIPICCGPGEE